MERNERNGNIDEKTRNSNHIAYLNNNNNNINNAEQATKLKKS